MHTSLFKFHLGALLFMAPGGALLAQPAPSPELTAPVTFETALRLALEADPFLQKLEIEDAVIDGQVDQASRRPNPVFAAEMENVLGTGAFEGFDRLEITLGLSQVFETGHKRAHRTALAESERGLLKWDRDRRRADIAGAVRGAFVEALLAHQACLLREEQLHLAEENLAEVNRQVEAARASEVDHTRARLEVKRQQFALDHSERQRQAMRDRLASWWGLIPAPAFEISGILRIEDPPALSSLLAQIPDTASLGRFAAEEAQRKAQLALEQSAAKPDFALFGGMRYVRDAGGDAAFVLGIELPWTLFDRNEGNIRSARAKLEALRFEEAATRRALEQQLMRAHRVLLNAFEEAKALEGDLRPAAEQTLAETQKGYERGQFTMLAVLESRRALFEIRQSHLDALERYASALVAIEALTRPSTL